MDEHAWSNDELRTFMLALRDSATFAGTPLDEIDRERFRAQVMRRIVPLVERQVLAEVGAMLDARGIAHVAIDVLADQAWARTGTWLMVSTDPWAFLADLVAREIRRAYKTAASVSGDAKVLTGIARVSTRVGIEGGGEAPGDGA